MPAVLAFVACTPPPAADGPTPRYAPESGDFFDAPWPSDDRRDPDGTLSFTGYPNPFGVVLVDTYLEAAEALDGFGTSSPIYVGFDGPLDPLRLPSPAESLGEDSPLALVDLGTGERFPVMWEQTTFAESNYAPEHLLAVAPLHGWALRGGRTYALLVTTAVARPNLRWREAAHPELDEALRELRYDAEDIAIATLFTTQDPVAEMADLAWFVREQVSPPTLGGALELVEVREAYTAYRTHYLSPVFTQGTPPYTVEGGEFGFDDAGRPLLARFDDLRLSVCVPNEGAPPPGGWPVVIYQHGTGGNYRGFCDDDDAFESMTRFAGVGLVGVGIDQPLHGTRPGADFASDINHFNIINPASARTNFRQGALDAVYLARALAAAPRTFYTPDGAAVPLDDDNVLFMGHSQGGLTGALATPFFGGDVRASALSGSGAVLAITVVERTDPLDFQGLVRDLLQMDDAEPISPLHPVLGLVQTMVDVTDPVNYARYWFAEPAPWTAHAPTEVVLTSGTTDPFTPYQTAIAMAAAGGLPQVGDPATNSDAVWLRSGPPLPLPLGATAVAFDGTPASVGFAQFLGGDHFVVFEQEEASNLVTHWLDTAAHAEPELSFDP